MKFNFATVAKAFGAAAFVLIALAPRAAFAQAVDVCDQMASLSATGQVAGSTNGQFGYIGLGKVVTMTASLNTATAGTFRIVGDPAGAVTLAGPSPIPGTLTYVGTGTVPPGGVGVGFFVDTATGGTVNVNVTCAAPVTAVPATSHTSLLLMAALLLLAGGFAVHRRYR
jgi:hypothetical protein